MDDLRHALAEATARTADSLAAAEARASASRPHDATLAERARLSAALDPPRRHALLRTRVDELPQALAEAPARSADSLAAAGARALDLQGAHDATLAEPAQLQARVDDCTTPWPRLPRALPTASPPPRPARASARRARRHPR